MNLLVFALALVGILLLLISLTTLRARQRERLRVRHTMHSLGTSLAIMKTSAEVLLLDREQLSVDVVSVLRSELEEVDRMAEELAKLSHDLDDMRGQREESEHAPRHDITIAPDQ